MYAIRSYYEAEIAGDAEQRDVAEVADQLGVRVRVAEHQVLDDEFSYNFV